MRKLDKLQVLAKEGDYEIGLYASGVYLSIKGQEQDYETPWHALHAITDIDIRHRLARQVYGL